MRAVKIAILGCRGIPNCYGGFEELAEQLSQRLVVMGFDVTVYNSHKHPYRENTWNGVHIVHCYDGEHIFGAAGQFVYDYNCIRHAKKQQFDVLLFLGYTSSSVFGRWYPPKAVIISNMDGLEWKRSKYSKMVKKFLQYAEKLAIKYSDHLVADSLVIQSYLKEKYKAQSNFIPYGANVFNNPEPGLPEGFNISPGNYYMLMARIEPENNVEMILEGFHQSESKKKMIVVGNTGNDFGKTMLKKFKTDERIRFAGAIYGHEMTHALRQHCLMYFHGHSVGGTNPSLLEAMADGALIAAHDNEFNKAVLQQDAIYFSSAKDVLEIVATSHINGNRSVMAEHNYKKIREQYNWEYITLQYKELIVSSHNQKI